LHKHEHGNSRQPVCGPKSSVCDGFHVPPGRVGQHDESGASVEIDLSEDGRPMLTRAIRPMTLGTRVIPTPWSASGSESQEWDGLRVWRRMEAAWHLTEGPFTYVRIELTSFKVLR
jgi:hypothetical protein